MDTGKRTHKIIRYLTFLFVTLVTLSINQVYALPIVGPILDLSNTNVILTFTDTEIKETVSGSGYVITNTTLEIIKAGTYRIKGSCSEGNIEIKKGTTGVNLILDSLNLTSSNTAPIVVKKDGAQVNIKLLGTSTITDNENPENEFSQDADIADAYEGAAIKVKSNSSVTFEGSGELNINGNANNGIKGGQESTITINAGIMNINAVNNGLSCDGEIVINNGFIAINANNEGIKLAPDEGDISSRARLTMNDGKVIINAGQDGIQAQGDIFINGWSVLEITSHEDGIQTKSNFTMTNGSIDIHTFEGYNTLNFDKETMSAKGIKATLSDEVTENASNAITISGGTINIDSSDDAIHSDAYVTITGGTVTVRSGDDGIHSDTTLVIGTNNGLERDPEINVMESIEGIESGNVYIYSGKVMVYALDDGINTAGGASSGSSHEHGEHFNPETGQMEDNYALYGYGGNVFIYCEGDGLDANGSLYLYGGNYIIYHQDAQGNNSALDRDANLVIDGATVFSAGGVADNGHVDSTGSSQKIIIDTTDYAANSKIAVIDNGNTVFNDQIPKRSTYTFYSSPSLTDDSEITTTQELEDEVANLWNHVWNEGVIVTPATENTPGIMSYSCIHNSITERKTYFYKEAVEFSFINKTTGEVSVSVGNTTNASDFTTSDISEFIYLTVSIEDNIELISTNDGNTFEEIHGHSTNNPNEYIYHVNPERTTTFYVVYDGDVNMDGVKDIADSTIVARALASTSYENYNELTPIQKILADTNDDGLINSHDGLDIIKELTGENVYDESYFTITSIDPVILDGEHDGEATVSFLTKKAIYIDAMDGRYSPSQENPSTNGYLELVDIEGTQDGVEFTLTDVVNGFAGAVDRNGLNIPKNTTLVTLKYKVDKNTPTGTYPVKLRIDSVTAHDSKLDATFELTADVIVKGTQDPVTGFFTTDEGVAGIDVYYKQNYNVINETNVSATAIRDPDTGEIIALPSTGQLNFTVRLKEGYIISNINVTPSANYKNLKGPSDTEKSNTYRITQIKGDIEITITTKEATEYTTTFITDDFIASIDVYHTKDYTSPDEVGVSSTFARDGDTGAVDISGEGQINFRVNPLPGYKVDTITISGSYKNLKEQENRIYRVTKISGDLIVTITSSLRETVTPEVTGYEESYVYTGSKIKPNVVVTIPNDPTPITLIKDTDYEVTYGSNKNVGENAGSITITSKEISNYIFDPITVNFDITRYTLTEDNITAPRTIVYTGSNLSPEIIVAAHGKTLVEGTDYNITYTNQDAAVGENVVVTITGIGNYQGTVSNINVEVTAKKEQTITFDKTEVTKVYGDDYTLTATLEEGDGTIRYTSNNTEAAIVDENTGAVTLKGTGTATIRAIASETDTYAETIARYKLIVKKAPISIGEVIANNKPYDGNKTATVSSVTFNGLVKEEVLVEGVDYTVTAEFDSNEIGTDKEVSVTINLSTEVIKRYTLDMNTITTTANITMGEIKEENVLLSSNSFVYNGSEQKPNVTVQIGEITLTEGVDYTVEYQNTTNAGTASVIVTGIGAYATASPIVKNYTIEKKPVNVTIASISDVTYNGGEQRPTPTVTTDYDAIELDKDYTVEYDNNVDVGEGTLRIIPKEESNFTFDSNNPSASQTFTINAYELQPEDITLSYYLVKNDGEAKEPEVEVVANGIPLIKDFHYSVSYSNNTNETTTATVTITALSSNYTGTPSVYFEITNKDILRISGIEDNQKITYTGEAVVLQGELTVSENDKNITPEYLTTKWYNTNDEEIDQPTNVGDYYVVYSYLDSDYKGDLKVNFTITKKTSDVPESINNGLIGVSGDPLSSIDPNITGFTWSDATTSITEGTNSYQATYLQDNDSNNYEPITINVSVYGKKKINIITKVEGEGGAITESFYDVLEGETRTIKVTSTEGYTLEKVSVDGSVVEVNNDEVVVTAKTTDMEVIATFFAKVYSLSITGTNVNPDPDGIIMVNPKTDKSITLNTKPGYRLTSVKVNGEEVLNRVVGNTITLTNITEDTNIVTKAVKNLYELIEGDRKTYTINQDSNLTYKIDANSSLFKEVKVLVDNEEINSNNYTVKADSTTIILNKDYLDSLSIGTHTLTIYLSDGGSIYTTFTIAKVTTEQIEEEQKGNKTCCIYFIPIIIILIILILITIYKIIKDKQEKDNSQEIEKNKKEGKKK